jgi:hypothetical protein
MARPNHQNAAAVNATDMSHALISAPGSVGRVSIVQSHGTSMTKPSTQAWPPCT